jgi:esterase/lipase superfamily enzyme
MRLSQCLLLGMVACQLSVAGCRVPDPPVLQESKIGVHYDTAYESLARSDSKPALLDGVWDQYVDTLAEPVAITRWDDGVSTWEVFFATNRGLIAATAGTGQERFGNEALAAPQYGRAEVTLPRRKRGETAVTAATSKRRGLLPVAWSSTPDDEAARFESIRSCAPETFFDGVSRQVVRSRQHDLLLFVHGFNVDFESSLVRTAQLAIDMPFNGAIVAYSWPTQGGTRNYSSDEPVNANSVGPFTEFLQELLGRVPPGTRVHIIVHSMGNRIVMQALNRLPPPGAGPKPIANVCLCAPDVGAADYQAWIGGVARQCRRVTLYANASDGALILSKGLHTETRAGDAEHLPAAEGVEAIDCSRIDLSALGHSYFSGNVSVLSDLFSVIKEDQPASARPHLKQVDGPEGHTHWTFDRHPHRILWTWHFDDLPTPSHHQIAGE